MSKINMTNELSVEEIFHSIFCRERFYALKHMPYFAQVFAPYSVQESIANDICSNQFDESSMMPKPRLKHKSYKNNKQPNVAYSPSKLKSTKYQESLKAKEKLAPQYNIPFDGAVHKKQKSYHNAFDKHEVNNNENAAIVSSLSCNVQPYNHYYDNVNSAQNEVVSAVAKAARSNNQNQEGTKILEESSNIKAMSSDAAEASLHHNRHYPKFNFMAINWPNEHGIDCLETENKTVENNLAKENNNTINFKVGALIGSSFESYNACYQGEQSFDELKLATRYALDEDRLHLTLSAPLRRLQQKTQVFPLDVNASSRSRLTHSYEVAAYAKLCIRALVERMPKLESIIYELIVSVENASLLHDLGNPPFGHFGEQVFRRWLVQMCKRYEEDLTNEQIEDLCAFNGNAQGLRLIHSVQRMNLTLGQIAAFIKVPFSSSELRRHGLSIRRARRYAGFFLSEKELIDKIKDTTIGAKHHPLALILEQCDDLAYVFADLEDAYDRKVIKDLEIFVLVENLINYLKDNACNTSCDLCTSSCACAHAYDETFSKVEEEEVEDEVSDDSKKHKNQTSFSLQEKEFEYPPLQEVITEAIKKAYCQLKNDDFGVISIVHGNELISLANMMEELGVREILAILRECITTYYLNDIVEQICKDEIAFFIYGELKISYYGNAAHKAVDFLRNFEEEHIYYSKEVESLELQGAAYLRGILSQYQMLLELPYHDFKASMESNGIGSLKGSGDNLVRHLIHRISRRYKEAYFALCSQDPNNQRLEKYARIRLIIDYISSMTDTFVAHEFAVLTGGANIIRDYNF